ncbi:MAG: hypothetical protein CXX73_03315 [Methanobacteriota archaeon]|nr:MAG: hypothetical protein CXX73_03315 [Euryarchaeota archaeon]
MDVYALVTMTSEFISESQPLRPDDVPQPIVIIPLCGGCGRGEGGNCYDCEKKQPHNPAS